MVKLHYFFILLAGLSASLFAQHNFHVKVSNYAFTPKDITITVGDTVTWDWASGSHTTTSDSTTGGNSWNEIISSSVTTFSKIITTPGLHRYYCIPHGGPGGTGMSGTITANPVSVTSVNESNTTLNYNLDQNYPNPFNPSTIIKYSIPQANLVTLKVFNALGQEVMTLVNETQAKGTYQASFNASDLTSGLYFYQIKAGDFISVRKMTLIK